MKRYEGMFLFDNAIVHEWAGIEQEMQRLMERIGGKLLVCVKFDERKLAFEIKGRKRGTYVLSYFDAPGDKIGDLERDVQLSETVLRVLVLRRDMSEEKLTELRARPAHEPIAPQPSDSRDDRGDRGDRRDRGDGGEMEGIDVLADDLVEAGGR